MTATNDFLPFATGGGANVLTQLEWSGLSARSAGFVNGIANAQAFNKAMRQSTVVAAMVGQIVADFSGDNAVDDGNVATLEAAFLAALSVALTNKYQIHIGTDTGTANAMVVAFAPTFSSFSSADGVLFEVTPAATNSGATTLNASGLGTRSVLRANGSALAAGDIVSGAKALLAYDEGSNTFRLLTPPAWNFVSKAGDTMTGALSLAANAASAMQAVPLQQLTSALNDAHSFASPGYQRLPSGLILQWATGASDPISPNDSSQTITLPITFPTACLAAYVTTLLPTNTALGDRWYQVVSTTTSTVFVRGQFPSNGGLDQATIPSVFAIGY